MNSFLDRLDLRPQERRLVVGVATILFIVLNLWLVWPHFNDWKKASVERTNLLDQLHKMKAEINPTRLAEYKNRLQVLEGEASGVLPAEQSLNLINAIQTQAAISHVNIQGQSEILVTSGAKTNEFFEEKARQITVVAEEKALVDFLVSIGSSGSIIRAKTMTLQPDATQTKLQGTITLVASYQKKPSSKMELKPFQRAESKPAPTVAAKPPQLPPGKSPQPVTTKPPQAAPAKTTQPPTLKPPQRVDAPTKNQTTALPPGTRDKSKKP